MQDEHLIAFESRKLNKREQLKSTYDKEMLAHYAGIGKVETIPLREKIHDPHRP